eukprot:UN22587
MPNSIHRRGRLLQQKDPKTLCTNNYAPIIRRSLCSDAAKLFEVDFIEKVIRHKNQNLDDVLCFYSHIEKQFIFDTTSNVSINDQPVCDYVGSVNEEVVMCKKDSETDSTYFFHVAIVFILMFVIAFVILVMTFRSKIDALKREIEDWERKWHELKNDYDDYIRRDENGWFVGLNSNNVTQNMLYGTKSESKKRDSIRNAQMIDLQDDDDKFVMSPVQFEPIKRVQNEEYEVTAPGKEAPINNEEVKFQERKKTEELNRLKTDMVPYTRCTYDTFTYCTKKFNQTTCRVCGYSS